MTKIYKKKINDKWVVADFETTTERYYNEHGKTEVWLYAISDKEGNILNYGFTIKDFMKYVKNKLNGYIIYFHNLKFDGSFILNWILNKNIPYKEKIFSTDTQCYNTLISEEGQFYQIVLHFNAKQEVRFQDSLKILPFKVRKIAEDFGLEWNGEDLRKLKIDYNDYTVDKTKLDYVFNDVRVVALALNQVKNEGMVNMTTASCAYNSYINNMYFTDVFFPELDEKFLIEWREAYRGGRSQVNPMYANAILHNVKRYDVNSMYPYVMYTKQLPIGKPIKIDKIDEYNFELYKIEVKFTLKEGHLPTLLKKNFVFGGGTYYENLDNLETIWISSIDYKLLLKHYDIECIVFLEMWGFETVDFLFKKYIDKWYAIKNREKGAKKQVAKLMLNSLYGKFGSNCQGRSKLPLLDEDGSLTFKNTEVQKMRKYYLPIAIAIVSYAHEIIDDAICSTGVDKFVYCDTDSVHTLGDLPVEMIDNKKLGKFKLESVELISKYVRQKTYVYKELNDKGNIEYTITCAGMNDDCKAFALEKFGDDIFTKFQQGFEIKGKKLVPKQVKGGTILVETSFKIKED